MELNYNSLSAYCAPTTTNTSTALTTVSDKPSVVKSKRKSKNIFKPAF